MTAIKSTKTAEHDQQPRENGVEGEIREFVRRDGQALRRAPESDSELVAHNISWNQYCLAVPANTPFTISITNEDQGIQHNFSIYDSFFESKQFFTSPRITGVTSETLYVSGLPPCHYYFQCDVHGPAMSGAFIVAPKT